LISRGVREEQILLINFESFQFSNLKNDKLLYEKIELFAKGNLKIYLLFDEIQEVGNWEKAINAIRVDFHSDIYLTGSNSNMLSSELSTYLAGRFIEIPVYPLSFQESLIFQKDHNLKIINEKNAFLKYLTIGGFPVLYTFDYQKETAWKIVSDIYSSVLLRDTVQRNNIRDVELLERIVRFVFDNVGSIFSAKKVADYFKSQQRRVDLNTVYNYLNALESAYLIYRIPRFDLKGKEILKTNEKYFVGDHGMIYAKFGQRDRLISGVLENVVFLNLKAKGYQMYTGKLGDKEVDFVAEKGSNLIYIQVAYKISEPSTLEREYASLMEIKDNFPKYLLTMDDDFRDNYQGIQAMPIHEFLLMD
jgi:uncharacterized protein